MKIVKATWRDGMQEIHKRNLNKLKISERTEGQRGEFGKTVFSYRTFENDRHSAISSNTEDRSLGVTMLRHNRVTNTPGFGLILERTTKLEKGNSPRSIYLSLTEEETDVLTELLIEYRGRR